MDEPRKRHQERELDEQLEQVQLEQLKLSLEKTSWSAVNYDVKRKYGMKRFLQHFVVGS